MENPEDVKVPESSPEEVVTEPQVPDAPAPEAEKMVPYSRFKEVNDKLNELKKTPAPQASTKLDVNEIIAINASLEGLSQREKEKLAEEHRLTGRPLSEIRQSEDFLLWQTGYNAKVEKERALKPSSSQPDASRPKTIAERLQGASLEETEKILEENGLWKSPRPKADRVIIGGPRTN